LLFPAWETFYVIVGSSGGALTGLMFVVIVLMVDIQGSERTISAFGTPTVVHLSAVLFLSAIMSAPWPAMLGARIALATYGSMGMLYVLLITLRARRQTTYKPVFEDWLFHAALPFVAYLGVLTSGVALPWRPVPLLFVIGGAAVLLVVIGVHNAWDTVKYVILRSWQKRANETRGGKEEWS
jgi:hypothetical protein